MLSFSPAKILIVLVVALVLLGPDKLPQMSRQLGAAWKAFRSFRERIEDEVRGTLPDLPSTADIARAVRSPVAFLDTLADMSPEEAAAAEGSEQEFVLPDEPSPGEVPGTDAVADAGSPLPAVDGTGPTVIDPTADSPATDSPVAFEPRPAGRADRLTGVPDPDRASRNGHGLFGDRAGDPSSEDLGSTLLDQGSSFAVPDEEPVDGNGRTDPGERLAVPADPSMN